MHMIRHNDKFIQRHIAIMSRDLRPITIHALTAFIKNHRAVFDLTQAFMTILLCTPSHDNTPLGNNHNLSNDLIFCFLPFRQECSYLFFHTGFDHAAVEPHALSNHTIIKQKTFAISGRRSFVYMKK